MRTVKEYKKYNLPNSTNISVDEVRQRFKKIPQDKTIEVFCYVGIRAHIAFRILKQKGYKVLSVSEGTFCTSPTGEPTDANEKK